MGKSAFQAQVDDDNVNVFLNLDEFAEYHTVEGTTIRCVVDDDIYNSSPGLSGLGITDATFTLFVRDWEAPRLKAGDQLEFDNQIYTVIDWRTDKGIDRITLRQPVAY